MLAMVIIGFVLVIVVFLGGCQRSLIYLARPYEYAVNMMIDRHAERIEYRIGAGPQVAFYVAPAEDAGEAPDRLWVLAGGNGALALDWFDLVDHAPDPRAGFLLVDYPGYGFNAGRPNRECIREGMSEAFAAAARRFEMDEAELARRTSLMGHSLGAAAVLDLAVGMEPAPRRIILVSPFTSLIDMVRLSVGWPLCHMLLDRFDNEARLTELADRDDRPRVTIIHGDADQLVPIEMARRLARPHPEWVELIEIERGDHNWILTTARPQIMSRIQPPGADGGP